MYMRSPYIDHNSWSPEVSGLGFEPVSTAVAAYQLASSVFGKKKQPGTDFYSSYKNLRPGEYITWVDPTPGRSSVTTQMATPPPVPTATVSPPTPIAAPPSQTPIATQPLVSSMPIVTPQASSMQPMSVTNYSEMPTLPATPTTTPNTPTDFTIPLLLSGGLILALLLTKKG